MNDLTDEGVDTTTARRFRAVSSLETSSGVILLYLSKEKVKIGLRIPAQNLSRSIPALKSSSAAGTTSIISVSLLLKSIASKGPITVVLPAPIII